MMTTLILSVFFSISAFAYDVEVDGIYYNFISVNSVEVTSGEKLYNGEINIPSTINNNGASYNVECIGIKAFYGCESLKKVSIPNSVTTIERDAFSGCTELTSVNIPNTVTVIRERCFFNCKSLPSIIIPNSVTNIEHYAFNGCESLKSISIPNSVTKLGYGVFTSCHSLTKVVFPNSLTNTGNYTFNHCLGLSWVIIPSSITSIGEGTFDYCSSLSSINIPNSVTLIGKYALCKCEKLLSISIPNSVTCIDEGALSDCENLTTVKIGENVQTINEKAFSKCKNLKTLECLAVKVPSTSDDVFNETSIENAILIVPKSALTEYKSNYPWNQFGTITSVEDFEYPETPKCATPEITYYEGKLQFKCKTEDVEFASFINSDDINTFNSHEVNLSACYDISVTAMKTGYDNSDVATAKLYWLPSSGTLEGDNINNVSMRGIAIQSSDGFINISGLDNNEKIDFFGVDGKALGSAKSIDGSVSFSAKQGTVVVAKIGKESVKIAVE